MSSVPTESAKAHVEEPKESKDSKDSKESKSEKKKHTSRCLACKKDHTYDVEFEGEKETKNGAHRFMVHGTCPMGHKIRTFIKKPHVAAAAKTQKDVKIDKI